MASLRLLASTLLAIPLCADTVFLVNGDRLSGTIKKVEDGALLLASDLLGSVQIDWEDVSAIEGDSEVAVLTREGERFEGRLRRQDAETQVVSQEGAVTQLPSESVARVATVGRGRGFGGFLSRAEGDADIGYSLARGNQNQTQSSVGARAEYVAAAYTVSGRLDSLFARQDEARSQSRHALNARLDRFVNDRVFAYGLSGLERNERRKLDLRTRLGGGVGWRLRSSNKTEFSALGGFAYVHENFRDQASRATGEGFVGMEWETEFFGSLEFSAAFSVHPDAVNRGRFRMEYDSTLSVPIAGRFKYSLRLFDRFDNRPAATVQRNDYGLVSAVGVSF